MSLVMQVIRKIETPKLLGKIKKNFLLYPSQIIAFGMGILLLYILYVIIVLQYLNSFPLTPQGIYVNILKVSSVVSPFFLIISRNKLKNGHYISFFLNSHIKSYQLLIGTYIYLFIYYLFVIILLIIPLLIIFNQRGIEISLTYICLLVMTLAIIFYFFFTLWMGIKVMLKKVLRKPNEYLSLSALLLVIIMGLLLYLLRNDLVIQIGHRPVLYFLAIISASTLIWISFYRLSNLYLMNLFIQSHYGKPIHKIKAIKFKNNRFLCNLQLEILNFYRNKVFKEQSIVFMILVFFTFFSYFLFDKIRFAQSYSYLVNFGMKEIFIMLPLVTGNYFREFKNSIHILNLSKYSYFLPRILFLFAINHCAYTLFILLTSTILRQGYEGLFSMNSISSMTLVIMVSMFFGFAIEIDDSNKPILLISIMLFMTMLEFVMHHYVSTLYIINLINMAIAVFSFLFIQILFLRKPILK